jgi:Tfp pilus assembly protein PilF
MSLLLQALQKAAKNREASVAPVEESTRAPEPAVPPALEPPATILPAAFAVETKEPDGPREPELTLADEADLFEADEPLPEEPAQRFEPFGAAPGASPADAAAILRANEAPRAGWIDFIRDRPVPALAIAAAIFLLFYGVYVYLQIAHPGILRGEFVRQPLAPQVPPPAAQRPAPPPKPAAPSNPLSSSAPVKPEPTATAASASTPAGGAPTPPQSAATVAPTSSGTKPNIVAASGPISVPKGSGEPSSSSPPPRAAVRSGKPLASAPAAAPSSQATAAEPGDASATPEPAIRPLPAIARPRMRKQSTVPAVSTLEHEISSNPVEQAPGTVAPLIRDAYQALQDGHVEQAETLYRNALQNEGQNVDALLGLAAIAAQRGQVQQAIAFYDRALEAEPRNATAQAGLIALIGQADPQMSETRLKQLIAREPSAFLYYSLGNLYAGQNQWPPAQQSYFQAFQMQPDNADYAYNLAVGLEHLNQSKLALSYYRKAIDLSFKKGQVNFDQKRVIERIGQLSARFD